MGATTTVRTDVSGRRTVTTNGVVVEGPGVPCAVFVELDDDSGRPPIDHLHVRCTCGVTLDSYGERYTLAELAELESTHLAGT